MRIRDNDKFRLRITRAERPNSPGMSRRVAYKRSNQHQSRKKSLRNDEWRPPGTEHKNAETSLRSVNDQPPSLGGLGNREDRFSWKAKPLKLGFKDQPVLSPREEEEGRARRLAGTLEILQRKREQLEERNETRRKRDDEFREKCIDPPPPRYHRPLDEEDKQIIRKQEAERKATEQAESIQRPLAQGRIEKANRQEQKKAEGRARQVKAGKRSRFKKSKWPIQG
jgi:hypothetical protein